MAYICTSEHTDPVLNRERLRMFFNVTVTNDDRLDALAMAVQYWVDAMAQDAEHKIQSRREEVLMDEVNRIKDMAGLGFALLTGTQDNNGNYR